MAERPDPFARLLGFSVLDVAEGTATVRATVGAEHLNAHGTVHGGFLFALADEAFALASNSHGPVAMALAASIHFTRTASPGDVIEAAASEVSLGRNAATYEVRVTSDGRVLALFTGTVHRRDG